MLALVPKTINRQAAPRKVLTMEEPRYGDHFTPADRRELIETGLNLKNLAREFVDWRSSVTTREREKREEGERMDERVRALENFRWWILGASAGCGALFGLIGSRFFHP